MINLHLTWLFIVNFLTVLAFSKRIFFLLQKGNEKKVKYLPEPNNLAESRFNVRPNDDKTEIIHGSRNLW